MNIEITKVSVTPKIRSLKNYFIHDKGITIVRIGGNKFKEMEAWLTEHGGTILHDGPYTYSRTWQVSSQIKSWFILKWAECQ